MELTHNHDDLLQTLLSRARSGSPGPKAAGTPVWFQDTPRKAEAKNVPRDPSQLADEVAKGFAECVRFRAWPLLLVGPPGRGKTTNALLLADHCRNSRYLFASDLIDRDFSGSWQEKSSFRREYRSFDLVILDQFGMSDEVSQAKVQVFVKYLEVRIGYPTILCSNFGVGDLEQIFDKQISSRLEGGVVVDLSGRPDYRLLAAKQRKDQP